MSNEIGFRDIETGLTLKACVVHPLDRSKCWNGTAFAVFSSINLATWRAALVSLTEQALSSAEETGLYVGNKPTGVPLPFTAIIYSGATPSPGDIPRGIQEVTELDLLDVGAVVADGSNTSSTFKTDLTASAAAEFVGRLLIFASGNANKEPRRISGFNTGTNFVTLSVALSTAPAAGDAFTVLGYIEA